MPVSEQFKAWFQQLFSKRKKRQRRTESSSSFISFLEESRAVSILVFVLTVAAIVVTSFVGIKPTGFQILPGQTATIRIAAAEDFSYQSDLLSERKREQLLNEVPHVYKIDMDPYSRVEQHVNELLVELEVFYDLKDDLSVGSAQDLITRIASSFSKKGNYRASSSDLELIVEHTDLETLKELILTGLSSMRESYKLGVYSEDDPNFRFAPKAGENRDVATIATLGVSNQEGVISETRVESLSEARKELLIFLGSANVRPDVSKAAYRILRDGLQPNLTQDRRGMEMLRQEMRENFQPVIVHVPKGAAIIELGAKVTPEQHEQLTEYQRYIHGKDAGGMDLQLVGRMLLVLAMLIASTFYIQLEHRVSLQSNGRLSLLALVLVTNLLLVRFCFELGNLEIFLYDKTFASILFYITPTALAPMIVAVLIGRGPGLLTALMMSLFTGVMFGNRLDLIVTFFLAATVAIYMCRDLRKRGRVVSAGLMSGLSVALFTLLFNWVDGLPWQIILNHMLASTLTGLASGVVVVGVLPILEVLFKRTTDITLLELSDYNHPILRRMQLEAPGTWHHSLMVANLAENAANAILANGLLARVSCMFHDIGKLVKPEYFTENQLDGRNPHDEKTPSFSALIIKSHVKEGVDLGLTYKLPRPIIDVIRQHHGTNLIRYFFHKAKTQAEDASTVHESTYRYDGPKPQSKEIGIILLADSIEAASRSLAKATPQNIEELVDKIFASNIEDGQLDECPLTIRELAKVKESFIFTLLNSLHSRIAYPAQKEPDKPAKKSSDDKRTKRLETSPN